MYYINNNNIFAFSDTHCRHNELKVPENVDIVICAGDAVEDNLVGDEYDDFIEWFASCNDSCFCAICFQMTQPVPMSS